MAAGRLADQQAEGDPQLTAHAFNSVCTRLAIAAPAIAAKLFAQVGED
jgi:hypothetical protein